MTFVCLVVFLVSRVFTRVLHIVVGDLSIEASIVSLRFSIMTSLDLIVLLRGYSCGHGLFYDCVAVHVFPPLEPATLHADKHSTHSHSASSIHISPSRDI